MAFLAAKPIIGAVTDTLGTNANFQAQGANVLQPANIAQAQQGYNQTNAALTQQRAFLNALSGQNGVQNQSDVFQQQQALANQIQGVANGTGPNPAQAELNQATGQNVANQAALMAGQRGAGANAGLLSRQIANQRAATEQQAAGQGATLQAQQQLAALQALQSQQAQLANTAGQQVGQQQQGLGQFIQGASANQSAINNQINSQNQANVGMQSNINNANAGIASGNAANQAKLVGGLIGGAGAALGMAHGGSVPSYASGGMTPQSFIGRCAQGYSDGGKVPGKAEVFGDSQKNDTVPANLSPGEIVIPRSILQGSDPIQGAAAFVAQELKKHQGRSGNMAVGGMTGETVDDPNEGVAMSRVMGVAPPEETPLEEVPQPALQIPASAQASGSGEMQIAPQPPQNSDPMGYGQYLTSMQKGIGAQQTGISGEAKAQGALGQEQAGIEHERQGKLQEATANYQEHYKKLDNERQSFMNDVQNGHIDPKRYIGSMDTGKKLQTAIGLILGGIGGGLTGQENPALKFLNAQIDRDIESQKSEMGKKENLLSMNMRQFGNLNEAMNMTRVQMLDMANSKISEAAAKAQDPMAKARAMQASGQLTQQAAPIMQQIAANKTLAAGAFNSKDPSSLVQYKVPKEHQAKVFSEIEAAQNTKHMKENILKSFEEAAKENTVVRTGAGLLRTPGSVLSLHQNMQPTFKDLEGTVRQAAMDNTFKNITPMPGDTEHKIEQKRQALQEYLKAKQSAPTAKGFGIDLSQYESTGGLSAQQKEWSNWADKHPNDPRAKALKQKLGLN